MFYPSTKLAFATPHIFNRRVPSIPKHHLPSSILKLSSDESSSETKDWFSDGREVAKQLKMELGITNSDDTTDTTTTDNVEIQDDEEESSKFKVSNDILESGRAAARELLKDMMTTEDNEDVIIQSKEDKVIASDQTDVKEDKDYFKLPSRKSHCYTICMVPPPSATQAWEELTAIRKQCKDPGFYRWPPHANILYPFLEPKYDKESEESKDDQRTTFRNEMAIQLSKAAKRCEPFDVTIDTFGTFGGKQRGVMWAYPRSEYIQSITDNSEELQPLHHLHRSLEEQFPMCKDQRKGGEFNPHMTISHYANNDAALAAKEEIESNWKPLSFHVPEIYLLERKGDDGQFKIAATIPLGKGSKTVYHNQPIPFPAMPKEEEEWVYNERMEMKNRRKRGNKRRKRRSKRSNVDTSSEEEEEQGTDA